MRKHLALAIATVALVSPLLAARRRPRPVPPPPLPPAVTVDGHADTPSAYFAHPFDLGTANSTGMLDYPRMKAGGLDAEFFAAYVPARYANRGAAAYCLKMLETIHEMVERYPQWARLATSTAEIRAAARDGKRAILIGVEGGHAIEDSLEILRADYRLGARYLTLTHTNSNGWADSANDSPRHNGLTPFGREVVLEMNRLGMIVDVSHASDKTFWDVLSTTVAPVIASHSASRALADNPRNLTDDMLRALAQNGGLIMVSFYPNFLSTEVSRAAEARERKIAPAVAELKARDPEEGETFQAGMKKLYAENPLPPVALTAVVDHIDHIVKVAGVDHVGLGSDFDGISATPVGMEDVSKLPAIRAELQRRGYAEADIRKIMGENFMRVFADVERVARSIRRETAPPATTIH